LQTPSKSFFTLLQQSVNDLGGNIFFYLISVIFLKDLLKIPSIGAATADLIIEQKSTVLEAAEREIEFMERNEIRALFYTDKNFPQRLKHYNDCPFLLFYKYSYTYRYSLILIPALITNPSNGA